MPRKQFKPYHKDFICSKLGEYKSPSAVCEIFKEKFGWAPWSTQIKMVAEKHRDMVDKFRVVYLKDLLSIPIAQKRIRLDRLEDIYATTNKDTTRLKCLAQAQEEIEGKTKLGDTFLNFQQNNVFTQLSDEELIKERNKLLLRIKKLKLPDKVIDVKEGTNA